MKRLGNLAGLGGFGADLRRTAMNVQRAPQMMQAVNQAIPQAMGAMPWAEQQSMAPQRSPYQTPGSIGFGAPGMLGGFGGFGVYGGGRYPSFGYGGGWPFALAQMMRRFY